MYPSLEDARESYRQDQNVVSLLAIMQHLQPGMTEAQVASILGEPDDSPIEGQVYDFGAWEGPEVPLASPGLLP